MSYPALPYQFVEMPEGGNYEYPVIPRRRDGSADWRAYSLQRDMARKGERQRPRVQGLPENYGVFDEEFTTRNPSVDFIMSPEGQQLASSFNFRSNAGVRHNPQLEASPVGPFVDTRLHSYKDSELPQGMIGVNPEEDYPEFMKSVSGFNQKSGESKSAFTLPERRERIDYSIERPEKPPTIAELMAMRSRDGSALGNLMLNSILSGVAREGWTRYQSDVGLAKADAEAKMRGDESARAYEDIDLRRALAIPQAESYALATEKGKQELDLMRRSMSADPKERSMALEARGLGGGIAAAAEIERRLEDFRLADQYARMAQETEDADLREEYQAMADAYRLGEVPYLEEDTRFFAPDRIGEDIERKIKEQLGMRRYYDPKSKKRPALEYLK